MSDECRLRSDERTMKKVVLEVGKQEARGMRVMMMIKDHGQQLIRQLEKLVYLVVSDRESPSPGRW